MKKDNAILFGPFVGELYWEAGRFAPMLPKMYQNNRKSNKPHPKYIVLTREDRFDLYGKFADILVPLRIPGDYQQKYPECFRLVGFSEIDYQKIAREFKKKYSEKYNIIRHVYPDIRKGKFVQKNQFPQSEMKFTFKPRQQNYDIVNEYLPTDKPLVVLAPRYRKGFKRNWKQWPEFYDMLAKDNTLMRDFNFIICGKQGEYVPDPKKRFLDINDMTVGKYKMTPVVGPNYTTKRQEQLASMLDFIQFVPQLGAVLAPDIARLMDWEGAESIAQRIEQFMQQNQNTKK